MATQPPPSDSNWTVADLCKFLEAYAPVQLAEDWDNVGLLLGDMQMPFRRIMTCLTITPDTAREAIDRKADVIVTHHPLPFRPLKKITTSTIPGKLLWEIAGARIAIYSAHTAYDSAVRGINARLAAGIGLESIQPFTPSPTLGETLGTGRFGDIGAVSLEEIVQRLKAYLKLKQLRGVGRWDRPIGRVGIGCGSGGALLESAMAAGCDLFITGEMTFHHCLEAEARGISAILLGHYASERFAMESLAEEIAVNFAGSEAWVSSAEGDPVWQHTDSFTKS
jgi:dinuclear metal center YbgI/SA1388 family protein